MVLAGGHGHGVRAVAKGQERGLLADERLFHHDLGPGLAERARDQRLVHGGQRLFLGRGHGHALAGGQTVGLDHHGRADLFHVGPGRGGVGEGRVGGRRHAGRGHDVLGEGLAAFEARGVGVRAEAGDAGRFHGVADAGHERRFGAGHDEVDAAVLGQGHEPGDVAVGDGDVFAHARRTAVSGRGEHRRHVGAFHERTGQGVLPPARADHEYAHEVSLLGVTGRRTPRRQRGAACLRRPPGRGNEKHFRCFGHADRSSER